MGIVDGLARAFGLVPHRQEMEMRRARDELRVAGEKTELVEGKIVRMPIPSFAPGKLARDLASLDGPPVRHHRET